MDNDYGKCTVGVGTSLEHQLNIIDFVQAQFKDYRLASVSSLEDETIIFSIENPPSTGRSCQSMRISQETFTALITTAMIYLNAKGFDLNELLKQSLTSDDINYVLTPNLRQLFIKANSDETVQVSDTTPAK